MQLRDNLLQEGSKKHVRHHRVCSRRGNTSIPHLWGIHEGSVGNSWQRPAIPKGSFRVRSDIQPVWVGAVAHFWGKSCRRRSESAPVDSCALVATRGLLLGSPCEQIWCALSCASGLLRVSIGAFTGIGTCQLPGWARCPCRGWS